MIYNQGYETNYCISEFRAEQGEIAMQNWSNETIFPNML